MTLATGEPILLEDVLAIVNARLLPTGDGSALKLQGTGAAGTVTGAQVIADYFALRACGCALDGKTDDGPAINALIAALAAADTTGFPRVCLLFPPDTDVLIATPINTLGKCWLTIAGAGLYSTRLLMSSTGTGIVVHGTSTARAAGGLYIRDISLIADVAQGTTSAETAVSACFDYMKLDGSATLGYSAFLMENVEFRNFATAVYSADAPRDTIWKKVNAMAFTTTTPGVFDCVATNAFVLRGIRDADGTFGTFNFNFYDVRVDHYNYAFDLYSTIPMEGVSFYRCSAYNGWGLVKAYLDPSNNTTASGYNAPMYYFDNCDYQGYGFAIDLYGCRDVRVNGGFYVANAMPATQSVPASPDGVARTHRSMMNFRNCYNVILGQVEFDSGGASYGAADTVVRVGSDCTGFLARDTQVLIPDTMQAMWEYDSGGASDRCTALDTNYMGWGGAYTVYDPDGTQRNQEAVFCHIKGQRAGNVDASGRYDIHQLINGTTDSSGNLAISFPTRQGGAALFLGEGGPYVNFNLLNSTQGATLPEAHLLAVTPTAFAIHLSGDTGGTAVSLQYRATGW